MFDAKHVFGSLFDCLDCGRDWPCPPYQDLICCVLDDDLDAVAAFMSWFVPTAHIALPGWSERAVQRRVVGWCAERAKLHQVGPVSVNAVMSGAG